MKEIDICLSDAYIEENILYAGGFEQNILLEYNMENQKAKFLGEFGGFKFSESYHIHAIYKYEKSLFCFSKNSYEVAEFNLEAKRFKYFYPANNIEEDSLVRSIIRIGDQIWMMQTMNASLIMVFLMKERRYIEHKIDMKGSIDNYIPLVFEKSVCIGTEIWRCIQGSSSLLVLDTKSLKTRVIETGLALSFLTLYREGDVIYILSMNGQELIVMNINTYDLFIYKTGYKGMADCPFAGIEKIKDYFLFFPCYEQHIFCYKLKSNELYMVKILKLPENFKRIHGTEKRDLFLNWTRVNDMIYLLPFSGNRMLRIDLSNFKILPYPVTISGQDYFIWLCWLKHIQNEREMKLKDFLNILTRERSMTIEDTNEIKCSGNFIWKYIKNEIDCVRN